MVATKDLVAQDLMKKFNESLNKSGINYFGHTGSLVCDILKKDFPQYNFDTRINGWSWFFIEGLWIRFYFGKRHNSDIITHYDFYEPFYKADD